jgi:hypothetical protein
VSPAIDIQLPDGVADAYLARPGAAGRGKGD